MTTYWGILGGKMQLISASLVRGAKNKIKYVSKIR
jgi:hypothetical protein